MVIQEFFKKFPDEARLVFWDDDAHKYQKELFCFGDTKTVGTPLL